MISRRYARHADRFLFFLELRPLNLGGVRQPDTDPKVQVLVYANADHICVLIFFRAFWILFGAFWATSPGPY